MNWYQRSELAKALDDWAFRSFAAVIETPSDVVVSQLSAELTERLVEACTSLAWGIRIEDASESECEPGAISNSLEPYRVTIRKPPFGQDRSFLTNLGFQRYLQSTDIGSSKVRVARLIQPFDTLTCRFTSWDDNEPFVSIAELKSPREIVRESGQTAIPASIGPFILQNAESAPNEDEAYRVWRKVALINGIRSLATEIAVDGSLLFRGSASVRLELGKDDGNALGPDDFTQIQKALRWVFDNPKETEMRHGLFAAEVSRLSGSRKNAADVLHHSTHIALDSARIGLQLGLAELNRDALKAVAELRKSVSDEAGKIIDSTRSTITAVSTAVFAGIGLIAARLTTATPVGIIVSLAIVLFLYVVGVGLSSLSFIFIQRKLRLEWRSRSYSFLTDAEFKELVSDPIERAENSFYTAVVVAALSTLVLVSAATMASSNANSPAQPLRSSLELLAPHLS